MTQALADRRLIKMVVSRLPGGLAEAGVRYASEASPPLLLIEVAPDAEGGSGQVLAELGALAEVCVAGTNLILLGTFNDVAFYRDLIRAGVADYLVLPSDPARLIEAILDLYQEPGKRPGGEVIAFIGAKGGCGSSTLACNTAFRLCEQTGADGVLLDLDLPFGSADLTCNIESPHGVQTVLSDPERIDDTFLQRFAAKYGERLSLLPAPGSLEVDAGVSGLALESTLAALRQQAKYVVLDMPRVWSEWVREVLNAVDRVVITATPDLPSVRNARNLADFLGQRRGHEQPPLLVLNRVGAVRRGEVEVKDFATTVGLVPTVVISEDASSFGQAATVGKMIEEVNRRAKAVEAFRLLAMKLGGTPVSIGGKIAPSGGGIMNILHRLRGKG